MKVRLISIGGLIGLTTITIRNVLIRSNDLIDETNEFNIHTNNQQKKHYLWGMHQPYLTKDQKQLDLFQKYFSDYQFLIENDLKQIKEKHSLKTPVKFQLITKLNQNEKIDYKISTLIVGGAPALISSFSFLQNNENVIYLNNFNRIPISNGSAWHLEQDAQTEAPTDYKPTQFLFEQIKRLLLNNITLKEINKTGLFPWRTIDWIQWIINPEHWLRAFIISFKFQLLTMFTNRNEILNDVSKQCFQNEIYFNEINKLLNNKLLQNDCGSIIIARNQQEINDLIQLKTNLNKEGRSLKILSSQEIQDRYHFIPTNALLFAEKTHDRVLYPNFISIIVKYLIQQGQTVIDGTLKTIFYSNDQQGGLALFKDQHGNEKLIQFDRLILSLGNQELFYQNNKRLFDVISARGVSILAHVYLPKHIKLPPVLVCGGTNHLTKLSSQPIQIDDKTNLYLMRFTAGACITPNLSNQYTSYYDSTIATGLIKSVQQTLGDQCQIYPIHVYGCNRQVSQYGQIKWIQPFKNIFIQYGAAGGGLTRAPDFITSIKNSFQK